MFVDHAARLCNLWTWESEHTILALLNSFFDQAKANRKHTQISNSTGQQTTGQTNERANDRWDGDMRGRKKNALKNQKMRSEKGGEEKRDAEKCAAAAVQCWHQYALIAQYFVGDNEAIAGNEHMAIKYA